MANDGWQPVYDFPDYEINYDTSEVRKKKTGELILINSRRGWEFVRLMKDKKMYYRGLDVLYHKSFVPQHLWNL